ncbi:UPF0276 protein [Qipengyuania nanhaisediminis]
MRREHFAEFARGAVPVDFVEVISENFMVDGGRQRRILREVRAHYPVALHGVSLSVGSAHGLCEDHLERLARLVDAVDPLFVSDHLCWTRTSAHNAHDLLPLPLTREALDITCRNVDRAQTALGRAILIENPSSYCTFPEDEMREWEFLSALCYRSGCALLLDINNVHVTAGNHGFDPLDYLAGLPLDRVRQIHLAGHDPATPEREIAIDTHDRPVCDEVWDLYRRARAMIAQEVATMIERDEAVPPLGELLDELDRARALCDHAAQAE